MSANAVATAPAPGPSAADLAVAKALLERCRAVFAVQEAWWFGSRANGTGHANSDWDLLVVAPSEVDAFERMSIANRATRSVPVECDIFVLTPAEFARDRSRFFTISWSASHNGMRIDGW